MPEHNYEHYSVDDLLQDDYFIRWMRDEDDDVNLWWQNWVKEDPKRNTLVKEARKKYRVLISFQKIAITSKEEKLAWRQLSERIDYPKTRIFNMRQVYFLRAAAACLIIALSIFIYDHYNKGEQYILTASKGVKTLQLEDGTLVTLNKGAVLERYSNVSRQVWISGQAYFEVNKVKGKANQPVPFLVHTKNFDVKVTGTVFVVQAGTRNEGVILAEGKVSLANKKNNIIMRPGQFARLSAGRFTISNVKPSLFSAWKDKEFNFDHTSTGDLGVLVQNLYGLKLKIIDQDAFKDRELNGPVSIESKSDFIKTIGFLLHADIRQNADELIVKPKSAY